MAPVTPTTATGFDWSVKWRSIDGELRSVDDILQDSVLANVLSDEGAIRILPEAIVASRGARPALEHD